MRMIWNIFGAVDQEVNCGKSFGEFCTNAAMDSKVLGTV